MTTSREAARRVEEDIANARVPPHDNQDHPHEQAPLGDQASVNPLSMMDGHIKEGLKNLYQAMNTQAQVVATQAQAMTAQANREVALRVNQNASTMASLLRDFIRMNPAMFFRSKVNEYPRDFLHKFIRSCMLWG